VLKRLLTEVDIATVQVLGWTGTKNGALLDSLNNNFDVLITSDQNLKYQQNLANRQIAVVQLPTNLEE
jgi:hypothetical protein